jgi:multiple sugar transport system permease protein
VTQLAERLVASPIHTGRSARQRRGGPWLWLLPAALIMLLVQIGPMAYAFWLSMYNKLSLAPSGTWAGFENYLKVLTDPEFWSAAEFGAIYSILAVLLQLVFGLPIALLLHRQFRGRGVLRGLVILPYMVPTASMALVFGFMMNDLYGVVNKVLLNLHVIDEAIPFYGDKHWVLPAVLLAATWKWTPFAVIIILARLQTIDQSLYECARVEGAGAFRCFRDITLPSLRGTLLLIVMLRGIWMFNKFDIPYLVTEGGPGSETTNLPIQAYDVTFLDGRQGYGAALSVVMFVLLLVFALTYAAIVKPEREVATE